jgi:hypothetical protein
MCKRDLKAQACWLSYTTSFLHLLKQETKGKLEGMRQIRDPRKNGIQLMSANKLIRKITSMPETSTEYIILSRRIEICGFSCKLLQITQRYRTRTHTHHRTHTHTLLMMTTMVNGCS